MSRLTSSPGMSTLKRKGPGRLAPVWRKALWVLREEGFFRAALRSIHKLCSPWLKFGAIIFFVQDMDFNLPERRTALDVFIHPASSTGFDKL